MTPPHSLPRCFGFRFFSTVFNWTSPPRALLTNKQTNERSRSSGSDVSIHRCGAVCFSDLEGGIDHGQPHLRHIHRRGLHRADHDCLRRSVMRFRRLLLSAQYETHRTEMIVASRADPSAPASGTFWYESTFYSRFLFPSPATAARRMMRSWSSSTFATLSLQCAVSVLLVLLM